MTYTCLTSNQEGTFIQRLDNLYNFYLHKEIQINDSTLSRRHISNIANKIIAIVNDTEEDELSYIPVRFGFKKLGDEKHRIALLITNNTIEVFDSNSWNYMLNNQKYRNKQNLVNVLNNVTQETECNIFNYNYSLNTIAGSCVSFALLFVLYRVSGLSIDNVCELFKFYESRTNTHYEKQMDKLIRQKEFNWNVYHTLITNLINNEKKVNRRLTHNSPLFLR